jgi:hypothetical protein
MYLAFNWPEKKERILSFELNFDADRRSYYWTMRLSSMRLLLRRENREYMKFSSKLVRWMRFLKTSLSLSMNKELWLASFILAFFFPNLACVQITSSIYFSLSLLLNFPFSGFVTDDIGSHIESAQAATSQGTSQLVKAAKTQRSNSSLVIYGISFIYSHFDY